MGIVSVQSPVLGEGFSKTLENLDKARVHGYNQAIDDLNTKGYLNTPQWQPIETAPRAERKTIWIWNKRYSEPLPAYSNTFWSCGYCAGMEPTHWMDRPTPQPPEGK